MIQSIIGNYLNSPDYYNDFKGNRDELFFKAEQEYNKLFKELERNKPIDTLKLDSTFGLFIACNEDIAVITGFQFAINLIKALNNL